jgi:cell division protein FtsL
VGGRRNTKRINRPGRLAKWWRGRAVDPNESRLWRRMTVAAGAVALLAVAQVWVRLAVQDLGYNVQQAKSLAHKLDLEHDELMAEEARQTAPERLTSMARSRLGLGLPSPGQVETIYAEKP